MSRDQQHHLSFTMENELQASYAQQRLLPRMVDVLGNKMVPPGDGGGEFREKFFPFFMMHLQSVFHRIF